MSLNTDGNAAIRSGADRLHTMTAERVGREVVSTGNVQATVAHVTARTTVERVAVARTVGCTISASVQVHGGGVRVDGRVRVGGRVRVEGRVRVGGSVRLANNTRSGRDVAALSSRANGENGALPLVTLTSEILVLGGLGADSAGKVDVREDAVLLGDSIVDLLVGNSALGLLLALEYLLLGGSDVAVVNVGGLLGVLTSLIKSAVSLLLDLVQHGVHPGSLIADGLLKSLLEAGAENLEHDGLEEVEEQLVVGLDQLNLQVLDIDVNLVNLEEVLPVLSIGRGHLHPKSEALALEENVEDTSVAERWESLLPLDVVAHIAQIHLDTGNLDVNSHLVLVGDLLATKAHVVFTSNFEDIGHEVVAFKDEVLNHGIDLGIRILDAGDRDVGNVLEHSRKDDVCQILDEMGLEGRLAVLIVAKVSEQLGERVGKALVLGVLVELIGQELELIDDAVGVSAVLVAEKVVAVVVKAVPLLVGSIIENIALLLEAAADVAVHGLEPVLELGISVRILINGVDGSPEIIAGSAVGEALNEGLEITLGLGQGGAGLLHSTSASLSKPVGVATVLLGEVEQSGDGTLVIRVLLAFNNHFLQILLAICQS